MDPQNMIVLISGAGFLVLFLIGLALSQMRLKRKARSALVAKIKRSSDFHPAGVDDLSSPMEGSGRKPRFAFLRRLGQKFSPEGSESYGTTQQRFLKAGVYWDGAAQALWGAKILLAFVGATLFLILRMNIFTLMRVPLSMSICILLAFVGFYLPDLWLSLKARRRQDQVFQGLPDALDLMVVCVEAGMGLDAAITRVGQEMAMSNAVISEEFKRINLELRAGMRREDALRNLGLRTDLEDVRSLATLLVQTEKFGTSIAKALRVFADSFRSKRFQKAEEIAAKMPVKLIFPLILFIFPAIFIVTVGPGAIRIYQNLLIH